MATATHRGITYTTSGSATITVGIDLPLWAGVDQDDESWLTSYPGALTSFEPRQTDGANRMQPRLVCLTLGNLADAETLTLSGDCNAILTHMSNANESVSADVANNHHRHPLLSTAVSGLVMTATCKRSDDGATGDTSNALVWLLVA
jgi:hypothetical protein